jgi:hypothetical protein
MARSAKARGAAAARVRSVRASEDELHRSVAEFLDWMLLPPTVWTTFPAGWGKLGKATAGRLKASGLKEGMPDILVFRGVTIGIELKTEKGKQSPAQITMMPKLRAAGVSVHVCHSIDEVYEVLTTFRVPMRPFHGSFTKAKSRRPPQPDTRTAQAP